MPQIAQRYVSRSKFTHGTPAGFPPGIPGRGEVIEGAIQHAPHPGRHSITGHYKWLSKINNLLKVFQSLVEEGLDITQHAPSLPEPGSTAASVFERRLTCGPAP